MHPRTRLATAVLAACLAACSSESEDSPSPPAPSDQDAAALDSGSAPPSETASDSGGFDAAADQTPDASYDDASADAVADASAEGDAAPDAPGEAGPPTDIAIAATTGQAQLGFTLAASGAGQKRLDALDIAKDVGTLTLEGKAHRGIAYQMHDWGQAGYVLYDVLSIAEDGSDLAVTYLYCQDTNLPYAYTESLVHPMDWETTAGTCEGTGDAITASADLPALNVTTQPLDTGISIQGGDLQLGPAGGNVVLGGKQWQLVPFNTVDCSTDCPGGSWYEIHTLLTADQQGCFAILYLFPDSPTYVQLSYTMCLPTLERPTATYQADWTGALQPKLPPFLQPMWWRPSPPLPSPESEWHFGP